MVQLTLPLLDNTDNEPNTTSTLPNCDPSQSIYDSRSCIKDLLFCSDDNPCPSKLPCIDRVCQCLPNAQAAFITLTPPPVRMYTIGCNFDTKRDFEGCRDYEYGVDNKTCVLNYCSSEVPCYAGSCDTNRHVCTNITASRIPLPQSHNAVITLGSDPFGTNKEGWSPVLIIILAAGGVVALALVGCVVRTATSWTKTSMRWASGGKAGADGDNDDGNYEKYNAAHAAAVLARRGQGNAKDGNDSFMSHESGDAETEGGMTRKPSKFTGQHYIPSPPPGLMSNDSNISPFSTPLPSPHFSPYSQTNQSQVSESTSLGNPFRHGAGGQEEEGAIEMNHRARVAMSSNGSYESFQSAMHVTPEIRTSERGLMGTDGSMAMAAAAGVAGGAGMRSSVGLVDPRISRSQTVSRELSLEQNNRASGGFDRSSGLHKSLSMQQLGSRPAPPPPGFVQSTNTAGFSSSAHHHPTPMIAVSLPSRSLSASPAPSRHSSMIMQGPALSLNSLMQHPVNGSVTNGTPDSPIIMHSQPLPSLPSMYSSPSNSPSFGPAGVIPRSTSVRSSPLVLQSGAERLPSLTVPPRQSMLKHSASVPQMVMSSSPTQVNPPQQQGQMFPPRPSSPSPAQRKLPAGFASAPVASSLGRFNS